MGGDVMIDFVRNQLRLKSNGKGQTMLNRDTVQDYACMVKKKAVLS